LTDPLGINKSIQRILITGGGTGGHLFPGIAVAEAILKKYPGSEVVFIGTERQIDAKALRNRPFTTISLKSSGLKGLGLSAKLRTILHMPASLSAAASIIRKSQPDIVLGVGGYVTGPVLLAARLLRVPCAIHEQNSVPGLANRLLGKIVDKVFISLPGSESYFPRRKTVVTGNPVREELLAAALAADTGKEEHPTLLVLGGSQGAHRLNMLMLEALADQTAMLPPRFKVIHQTGTDDRDAVREEYDRLGIEAEVADFFQNMAPLYQKAALVISRAGATTLAEIMMFGIPAILIPYPHAADNHQEKNGQILVDRGGASMFAEGELTGARLGREILRLLTDAEQRREMARKMRSLACPQATDTIIQHCLGML
jgi:UDP-N-acetylglucosamine--N-acetylmuramyl-(pentapeptide) pyrophosphoryl-undecaprenol N-acetylglucosamine transferase